MPNEVICLHVGQAGVQLGDAVWEVLANEHGIKVGGTMAGQYIKGGAQKGTRSFFSEEGSGGRRRYVPRAVLVDNSSMVIDDIRTGSYRTLFNPNCLISSNEDAANLFPRGYNIVGKRVLHRTIDAIREIAETTDMTQGLILFRSLGGGTGSGTTALILDELEEELSKISISEFVVFPSPCLSTSIVEPYNTVLTLYQTMRHIHCSFLTDNQAMYDMCYVNLDMKRPSYFNINTVLAHTISCLTTSLRFERISGLDINIFQTNLVPYPELKFSILSYAPLLSYENQINQPSSMYLLTEQVFLRKNFLIKCLPEYGEFMACAVFYRGRNCHSREIHLAIEKMKTNPLVKFVDWCPTGFSLAINHQRPPYTDRSCIAKLNRVVTLIANSTCIAQIFDYLLQKFDILFKSKAYVHWFTSEGLEEAEFIEARNSVKMVLMNYLENSTIKDK